MTVLNHSDLLNALHYEPLTGTFTWKLRTARRIQVGDVAGSKHSRGYTVVSLYGATYFAHVLAWFYMTGAWPTKTVDHENTIRSDNRFVNLRLATTTENSQNSLPHKDNLSGFKGVTKNRDKYSAKIRVNGVRKHLGSFTTPELAAAAYDTAANQYFGAFAKTNKSLGLIT